MACAYRSGMATTPEQRSRHALCGAKKKNGELCRAYAGQHTDHFGVGRCKYHGGRTQNHQKHAVAIAAQQRMVKMGAPLGGITSRDALLGLLRATAGHVAWLHAEIGASDDLGTQEGQVLVKLYGAERDRLAGIAKACRDSGIDEDTIRVTEAQVSVLGGALLAACDEAGIPPDQRAALGAALRSQLEKVETRDTAQAATLGPFA